ncbi:MAG: electron transfer flavoprotein subunit beta/FixA family protein [Nitrospirae bacterium]|nr:electron transfer flavoprotein subunit beta/FixA family protein [Nitrospirota bacterium]NTW65713.1 electron transfer flavoprotein subunit beta/FixA family protein [Nitrospirota bacterium]
MNIIVLVKQVPDTSEVKINRETNTLIRDGVPSIINPYDRYAIEEALRLREKHGGKVTAVTMGPPQAAEALKEAVSLGVDDVVLLSDRAFAGADTWATSYALSQGIRKVGEYDLVIAGKQAIDGDTAQVGPETADMLGIPFVAYIRKIEQVEDRKMIAERLMDEGYDVVETSLPALITVVKEINEPRVPSLKGKMKAKNLKVTVWTAKDIGADEEKIGLKGSPTQVVRIFPPAPRGQREILSGSIEDQVATVVKKLKEQSLI